MMITTPLTIHVFWLSVIVGSHETNSWSTSTNLASSSRHKRVDLPSNNGNDKISSLPLNFKDWNREFLSRAFVGSIGPPLIAAALVFGVADSAIASDETLLFDLSKEDSVVIEGRAPPEIKASSLERAMSLATKMKTMNAKMYGAYWCKFCAKQKEAFGKEAFETKNVEYVECSEDGKDSKATTLCQEKNIRGYPTWEIGGKLYSGERSLEDMEVLVRMVEATSPGQDKAPPTIMATSSERAMAISKQLKELNAQLFGSYWDPNTFEQKERLGAGAMAQLPYVECAKDGDNSQLDLCKERSVRVVPTWSIDGQLYPGDQDLEGLEEIIANTKVQPPVSAKTTAVASGDSPQQQSTEFATRTATKPSSAESPGKPSNKDSTSTAIVHVPAAESKPSPPPVTTTSNEKTLALAKEMEYLNTRMYGAYFCTHCKEQKDLFGREAFENNILYVECTQDGKDSQLSLCLKKGISSVPSWEINGKLYVGQRSIAQLQELVTAELAEKQPTVVASKGGIAPPPILATSSNQAMTLAINMQSVDAKLYGAHWCRFTQSQKEKFGSEAFQKIKYVECSQDGLNSATAVCRDKRIEGFPTWELGGKLYPGDQDLEELEEIVKEQIKEEIQKLSKDL